MKSRARMIYDWMAALSRRAAVYSAIPQAAGQTAAALRSVENS